MIQLTALTSDVESNESEHHPGTVDLENSNKRALVTIPIEDSTDDIHISFVINNYIKGLATGCKYTKRIMLQQFI